MDLLIKNVRIVDWTHDLQGDIYIKDGLIYQIGKEINADCNIINGEGMVLLPSFVDLHSHFRDPGYEYKEDIYTGCQAAVKGGYTAVNLMANTKPVCSNMDIVNYVLEKGRRLGIVDLHQTVSITKDFNGRDIDHLYMLDKSVRCISDDGHGVQNGRVMLEAMKTSKELGFTILCHEEDGDFAQIDNRLSENMMTLRDIELYKTNRCRLHICHVSTKEAMQYIIAAKKSDKKQGQETLLTCEITPHHIALSNEIDYRVNPHIREKEDAEFLISAVREGYVDCIATDHAPHSAEDKKNGAPGMSGLETAFSICYTKLVKENGISLCRLSEILSKRPAEILGLNKGKIDIGCDGDLVLIDINRNYTINPDEFASKGKNTPFNGMNVYGKVIKTIKGGKIVYNDNR